MRRPMEVVLAALCSTLCLTLGLTLAACGGEDEGDGSSSCGMMTTGLAGEGPGCLNWQECGDDHWELDCDGSGTGTCTCVENEVEGKTIPYSDAYCPADFGTADFDAHYEAARAACGWP